MKTKRNLTIIFLIISTLTIVFNTIAYGNSAEPPGITIIVKNMKLALFPCDIFLNFYSPFYHPEYENDKLLCSTKFPSFIKLI